METRSFKLHHTHKDSRLSVPQNETFPQLHCENKDYPLFLSNAQNRAAMTMNVHSKQQDKKSMCTSLPPWLLHKPCASHLYLGTLDAPSIHCPGNTGSNHPNCQCIVHTHFALPVCRCWAKDLALETALGMELESELALGLASGWEMDLDLAIYSGNVFVHSCISAIHFLDNTQNSWDHAHRHQTSQPIAHHHLECIQNHHCEISGHNRG